MRGMTVAIARYCEGVLNKTTKLTLSARDARKLRKHIDELSRIERIATEYRSMLQDRLDCTKRDDEKYSLD